jgi:hypothetical protein
MRRVIAGLVAVIFPAAAVLAQRPAMPVGQIVGAGAPGMNCYVGQKYFRTDAAAGSNMYLCTALPAAWTQSGKAGASTVTGVGTTNVLPKYTNGAAAIVGDSALADDGTQIYTTARKVGVGTATPDRQLHVEVDDAVTSATTYTQRNTHTSSGVVAANFGAGSEVELETATGGTNHLASLTETTWAVATAGSEESTWSLYTVIGGTVELAGRAARTQTYWGSGAGFSNTLASAAMFGGDAGYQNTGADPSMFGHQAGTFNSGAYPSIFGASAGYQNTGANPSMFGHQAGALNTGANPSMFGASAGYLNTGASASLFGSESGYKNTGAGASVFGASGGNQNNGTNVSLFGYQRGYQNNWDNVTLLGAKSATTFAADATTAQAFTDTEITANTITFGAPHGFAVGKRNLLFTTTAGTPPTGLVTGTVYQFTVVNATVVTKVSIGTDASLDFAGTLTNSTDVHNSIAIGYDAVPTKAHQAVLGNTDITETVLRGNIISNPGGTVPACKTYTVVSTNAAFQAASLTATVLLETMPAKAIVTGVDVKHSVQFSDGAGAMTEVNVSVGSAGGGAAFYTATTNIGEATGVADTTLQATSLFKRYTAASEAMNGYFTATGRNFGDGAGATYLTGGSVDIGVCWVVKP